MIISYSDSKLAGYIPKLLTSTWEYKGKWIKLYGGDLRDCVVVEVPQQGIQDSTVWIQSPSKHKFLASIVFGKEFPSVLEGIYNALISQQKLGEGPKALLYNVIKKEFVYDFSSSKEIVYFNALPLYQNYLYFAIDGFTGNIYRIPADETNLASIGVIIRYANRLHSPEKSKNDLLKGITGEVTDTGAEFIVGLITALLNIPSVKPKFPITWKYVLEPYGAELGIGAGNLFGLDTFLDFQIVGETNVPNA